MLALDLFSAAAGGWSLGLHRAGFRTVAACELIDWRRALYAENNPGVLLYDDVRDLTAARLVRDLGFLPGIVVGSPPCQDISSANTKGKGVEGERSGLFFEAIRLIGEIRPRWFALENSANLRTRGADAVLDALEALGYACWPCVVRAGDIGANHERARSWLIGCDLEQVTDPRQTERWAMSVDRGDRNRAASQWFEGADRYAEHAASRPFDAPDANESPLRQPVLSGRSDSEAPVSGDAAQASPVGDAAQVGCRQGRSRRRAGPAHGLSVEACGDDADSSQERPEGFAGGPWERRKTQEPQYPVADVADPDCQGQPDRAEHGEMGRSPGAGEPVAEPWAEWNGGLAHSLQLDDGLSPWVAGTRIAVGGPRGTAAASLLVEAFGDSVVPQIPEAIGRAILRTEAALSVIYAASPASALERAA